MSAALTARDAIVDAMRWEQSAHGWRLMALEGIAALRAAHLREQSLVAQLAALRTEVRVLRGCAIDDSEGDNDLLL